MSARLLKIPVTLVTEIAPSTTSETTSEIEQQALRYTLFANIGITAVGVVFALWTKSEAIFLDGLFSGIHLAISLLSLRIAQLIQQPGDDNYPFGYAMFEPFLNMGKGLVIVIVALFALFSATEALLGEGRSVEAGIALWYAVLAAATCLVMAYVQKRFAIAANSQILDLDFKNWLIDGAVNTAVAIAFTTMLLLQNTQWSAYIPYVDPALVLFLVAVVIPLPLQTVIQNSLQIVGRKPQDEQSDRIEKIVQTVFTDVPHREYHLRYLNMGRLVYVQVYLYVSLQQEDSYEPGEVDNLRERLYEQLHSELPNLAMDLVVTCDRVWVKRAIMPV